MKTKNLNQLKTLLLFSFFISFSFGTTSCFDDLFGEDDDTEFTEINDDNSLNGLYKKAPSQTLSYFKITSTKGHLCRADGLEFIGSRSGNFFTFILDDGTIEVEVQQEGDNIWLRQNINGDYYEWTEYFPTSDAYPCN